MLFMKRKVAASQVIKVSVKDYVRKICSIKIRLKASPDSAYIRHVNLLLHAIKMTINPDN